MEPNIEQIPILIPKNKSNFDKIVKWIFIVVVILCLIFIGGITFLIIQKNNIQTVASTRQVPQKSTPVPTDLKITFPKILTMTPLSLSNVPADIKIFSVQGSTGQTYSTILYKSKETGFHSEYLVPNVTVVQLMSKFLGEINSTQNKSPWTLLDAKGTNLDGYFEFQHNTLTDEVRVIFSQNNKNVNVTIQSIQLKK